MYRPKKVITVITFRNSTSNGYVSEYCQDKLNKFLKTIEMEDYISHEIDRTGDVCIRLTYKKIVED